MCYHSPALHYCVKQMELDVFFVQEKVIAESLIVIHIPAHEQVEDIVTNKP